jgi:hypothetical protein
MDHFLAHARLRGDAPASEKLTAVGYFSLCLILFLMGLYGFLILLRSLSSNCQQFSL